MRNFYVLTDALGYIEKNLENPLTQEEIAESCYCSVSALQKLFRYALRLGVKDYIARRRLTQAAGDLLPTDAKVLEVALKYQYQSPEVFSRAFARVWGTTPSAFRREWKFSGLYPKVEGFVQGGDGLATKRVDISEIYQVLRNMADTFVLCFDIYQLMPINEISHVAGDLAIVECLKRIDQAASEDMLLFRVGGDEFALVTGYTDAARAEDLAQTVLARNGEPIVFEGREIPVSMYAGGIRICGKGLRYAELFPKLQNAVQKAYQNDGMLKME